MNENTPAGRHSVEFLLGQLTSQIRNLEERVDGLGDQIKEANRTSSVLRDELRNLVLGKRIAITMIATVGTGLGIFLSFAADFVHLFWNRN